MHRLLVGLACYLALLLSGCGAPAVGGELAKSSQARDTAPSVGGADSGALAAGNTEFALDLYQQLRTEDDNLFFSPYSISVALAMTYAGARGQTERQMANALGFYLPPEELHPAFNALSLELARRGSEGRGGPGRRFELHVANALWGQTGHSFLPDFLDVLARNYGAGVRLVDFVKEGDSARATINQWVSDETKGKIVDLVPASAIDHTVRFVLTNAVYFDAAWQHKFRKEATSPGGFHLLDGRQVSAEMMRQTEVFGYAERDGCQALEMPYAGGELALVILLPALGQFRAFDASCDADRVGPIIGALSQRRVAVTVPRFKFESAFRLDRPLAAMGMRDAFVFPLADFSGMDGTRLLYLGAVLHKAYVAVDEEGTEAAAATAVVGRAGGAAGPRRLIEFTVDRPFLFLIRDVKTDTILFLGRVLDPTA